jgi:RNA polymerase sigma factor FliA
MTTMTEIPTSDELIAEYLSLAQSIAQQEWRKAPHALELDELRSIAHLGLTQAAKRWRRYCVLNNFDPARLEYFKPYVVRRVRGAIIDEIRSADRAKRQLRTKAKALQDAGQGHGLSESELAAASGLTVDEVRATIRDMAQRQVPASIEAEEIDPSDVLDIESSVFVHSVLAYVVKVLRELSQDEQAVIALRYYQGLHLRQVAEAMGISQSRVSQLHASAVLAVHQAMIRAAKDDA